MKWSKEIIPFIIIYDLESESYFLFILLKEQNWIKEDLFIKTLIAKTHIEYILTHWDIVLIIVDFSFSCKPANWVYIY